MPKFFVVKLLSLLAASLLPCISYASPNNPVSTHETTPKILNFGVEITNYQPYYFLDKNKNYQGAAREILDLFAETINYSSNYTPVPVARLFNKFLNGDIDFKFPSNPIWSDNLKKNANVFYSEPIFKVKENVLILESFAKEKNQFNKKKQNTVKDIGTILGFTTPGIDKNIENKEVRLIQAKSIEQLIHMLVSERVQGVYFNEKVALLLAKKMYPTINIISSTKFQPFIYGYHLSSINHPELIDTFNLFLNSHAKEIEKIKKRYGLN